MTEAAKAAAEVAPAKQPAVPPVAKPLPLEAVRLTGGPLANAQQRTADYLLELEPDRMLHFYRLRAGLEPKAPHYGGWDGAGRQLTGHIAGHYLSAVSLMFAATGDERFKRRADYIVDQFAEVQAAHGDGYLGAIMDGRECFRQVARGEIRSGGFDLNGLWAPWYTLHKTYAGLRDAYRHTGNRKALELEVRFAEWAEGVLAGLSPAQVQSMLNTEFGGMNEALVDLAEDTGDERWLELSRKFEHESIVGPLKRNRDILAGKHGNTQVPKLIGSAKRYRLSGDPLDGVAARFFWDRVVNYHTFASGGHGKDEYFGQPGRLNGHIYGRTAETCNIYNMLKLTRQLFALRPDNRLAAFHERALNNHILGSIDPDDGATCYMAPIGQGVRREYGDPFQSFTCCVGTGLESHALHGYGLYYETTDKLLITQYAPSRVDWDHAGVQLEVATGMPLGDTAQVTVTIDTPKRLTLALRRPEWATEGFSAKLNGEPIDRLPAPGRNLRLTREWRTGDQITLRIPKHLWLEPVPDNERRVALMWGPLMLVGDLGDAKNPGPAPPQPQVIVSDSTDVRDFIAPVDVSLGRFEVAGARETSSGSAIEPIQLYPFFRLHRRKYIGYFDLLTTSEWAEKEAELRAEEERQRRLAEATIAFAQPGQMQPERDFSFRGDSARVVRFQERPGRITTDWMSFEMPIDAGGEAALVVTYSSDEWRRRRSEFRVLVEGKLLREETIDNSDRPELFDVEYPLPPDVLTGDGRVTVRFEAVKGRVAGPVHGLRTIRRSVNE